MNKYLAAALITISALLIFKIELEAQAPVQSCAADIGSTPTCAITSIVSASAESSHILKASAGFMYGVYISNPSASGFLLIFNSTTVPGDGAVTPVHCIPVSASNVAYVNYEPGPPGNFLTGMTAVLSSTGCFTKTTSPTGFFHALVK